MLPEHRLFTLPDPARLPFTLIAHAKVSVFMLVNNRS